LMVLAVQWPRKYTIGFILMTKQRRILFISNKFE